MNEEMINILLAHYNLKRDKSDLIPLDKMIYRETSRAKIHLNADEVDERYKTWRKELALRSMNRAYKWQNYSSS